MNKKTLIIPAAGKGSRLKTSAPKIFTKLYGHRTIFDFIMDQAEVFFDRICLILSPSGKDYMNKHIARTHENLDVMVQPAANGMFDAINIALASLRLKNKNENIFIQWGDQPFVDRDLYNSLGNDLKRADAAIPLVWVRDPYVQFKFLNNKTVTILESREGDECDEAGFKDIGLFAFRENSLLKAWEKYLTVNAKGSITNEKSFLKIIPLMLEEGVIYWRTDQPTYKSLGINTPEELSESKMFIDQKRFSMSFKKQLL